MSVALALGLLVACSGPDTTSGSAPIELPVVEIEGQLPVADAPVPVDEAEVEAEVEAEGEDECPHDDMTLPEPTNARARADGDVLVWFPQRADTTLRIDGVTGEVVGTEEGNVIFADGKTWRFETTSTPTPRDRCPDDYAGASSHSFPWIAELVSGDERLTIAQSHAASPELEVAGYAELRASLGSIVFVDVTQHWSRCNAQRHDEQHVVAFDLARRAFVEPGAAPRFGEHGLEFTRLETATDTAKGWDVIVHTVEHDAEPGFVPPSLAAASRLPAGLDAFRAKYPEIVPSGFSIVDAR